MSDIRKQTSGLLFQAPSESPIYKVRARGNSDWKNYHTVRLEISVGQPYHEGPKLKAALDWATDHFKTVALIIGDLPQRYNIMFEGEVTEEQATNSALTAGDEWFQRNALVLNQYENIQIYRWGYWKNTKPYIYTRWQVGRLYRDNSIFRCALQDAITETWERRVLRSGYDQERKDEFFRNSTDYLLEETTVFALAYKSLPGISAYPGSFLEMWDMFVESDVPGAPAGLRNAQCLRLSFLKV